MLRQFLVELKFLGELPPDKPKTKKENMRKLSKHIINSYNFQFSNNLMSKLFDKNRLRPKQKNLQKIKGQNIF